MHYKFQFEVFMKYSVGEEKLKAEVRARATTGQHGPYMTQDDPFCGGE